MRAVVHGETAVLISQRQLHTVTLTVTMNVPRNNSMGMQIYRELVEREAKSNMQWALLCAADSNV